MAKKLRREIKNGDIYVDPITGERTRMYKSGRVVYSPGEASRSLGITKEEQERINREFREGRDGESRFSENSDPIFFDGETGEPL